MACSEYGLDVMQCIAKQVSLSNDVTIRSCYLILCKTDQLPDNPLKKG